MRVTRVPRRPRHIYRCSGCKRCAVRNTTNVDPRTPKTDMLASADCMSQPHTHHRRSPRSCRHQTARCFRQPPPSAGAAPAAFRIRLPPWRSAPHSPVLDTAQTCPDPLLRAGEVEEDRVSEVWPVPVRNSFQWRRLSTHTQNDDDALFAFKYINACFK